MEADLVMLNRRIARLEVLVGTPHRTTTSLQRDLHALATPLRRQVPDEMVAAFRALAFLSRLATPSAHSGTSHVRAVCTTVESLLPGLSRLQPYLSDALAARHVSTDTSVQSPSAPASASASVVEGGCAGGGVIPVRAPVIPPTVRRRQSALARRVRALALAVEAEDAGTDGVLSEFDAATARLNAAILALAHRTSTQPSRRPNGDGATVNNHEKTQAETETETKAEAEAETTAEQI